MDKNTINDIILEDRGKFYGCSRDTFFRKGTTFKHRDSLDGKNKLYVTKLFDHHFITTGKELIDKLNILVKNGQKELDTDLLGKILPDFSIEETYPHFLYQKSEIDSLSLPDEYEIRMADPSDHPPLQEFLDGCSEKDIDDALIELDDPDEEIRLVYYREKPVGYAGYRRWGVNMGDVGILIQEVHRKKGLGMAAVAEATKACLDNNCLPFYRTCGRNTGSQSIARKLGYQWEWATAECNCKL